MSGKVNGHEANFESPPILDKNFRHDIDVRIDRFKCTHKNRQRLTEATQNALKLGGGTIAIESLKIPDETIEEVVNQLKVYCKILEREVAYE